MTTRHPFPSTRTLCILGTPFLLAILLIIHHYVKHANDAHLTTTEMIMQWDDMNNHETWALVCVGIGVGLVGGWVLWGGVTVI